MASCAARACSIMDKQKPWNSLPASVSSSLREFLCSSRVPSVKAGRSSDRSSGSIVSAKESPAMNAPHLYERLTRENAVLLLVDHQVGLYTGVRDIDTMQLTHNVVGLAKAALALKIPVIV